jgi:O-antigen/teichoic acid export membrane protein
VFSPTVLGWLGTDFSSGVSSMVILSLGSIVMLAGGNVQSLLLMSGHSAWGALNKVVVVAFNVVGNLVLLPRMGIEGAALIWAASMALDTALAAWQVRRAVGVSLAVRDVLTTTVTVSLCVAVPAVSVILLAGQGLWQLLTSVVAGGLLLLAYCAVDRRRLRMDELLRLGRKRGEPGGTGLDASMKRGDG